MSEEKKGTRRLDFNYRESPSYRTVRAAGAYGGVTSNGEIFMGIYTQRLASPQSSYFDVDAFGKPSQEIFTAPPLAGVRDMEVGIAMDLNTALAIKGWLDRHVQNLQQQLQLAAAMSGKKQ